MNWSWQMKRGGKLPEGEGQRATGFIVRLVAENIKQIAVGQWILLVEC